MAADFAALDFARAPHRERQADRARDGKEGEAHGDHTVEYAGKVPSGPLVPVRSSPISPLDNGTLSPFSGECLSLPISCLPACLQPEISSDKPTRTKRPRHRKQSRCKTQKRPAEPKSRRRRFQLKVRPQNQRTKARPTENPPAFDVKNMDTSVKPEDDFYTYANGAWLKNNPIPPEESRWGSFNQLIEKNTEAMRVVAEKASKTPRQSKANPEVQKVGDYYASGMDEEAIDAAKAKPLADEFKRIDAMKDRKDVLKEIAHLHTMGVGAFFGFASGQDDKNSTMVIGQAYQGGLGMPDRDYYTKEDDASKKIRDQYVAHVTKMLTLAGEPAAEAADHAKKILAFETSLAEPARTRVELRDPQKNYNKMKQAELQALTPDWNWADYFKEIKLTGPGDINVGQPDFFKAANQVFTSTSMDDWKIYLRWHLVHAAAPELSSDFVNENFKFFGNCADRRQSN